MKTLYEILEVAEDATDDQIKAAFKRLAKEHHPDRHGGDKGREAIFKEITSAKEVLSDSEQRSQYDAQLWDEREAATAAMRARAEKEAEEARALARTSTLRSIALGGTAVAVSAGLFYVVYRAVSGSGQSERREEQAGWDPYAERYHGSDGRFYPEP